MIVQGVTLQGLTVTDLTQPVSGAYVYYDPQLSYSGTGSTITDLSGNNENGTLFNSPAYTSGYGGYFTLNGSNQYISTSNLYDATKSEVTTVEAWVYPTSTNTNVWSDSSNQTTTAYHAMGAGFIQVGPFQQYISGFWNNSTGVQRVVNGAGNFLNSWKQVVRVYNGSTCTPYLNGVAGTAASMVWTSPVENGNGNNWFLNFGIVETTTYSGVTTGWFAGRIGVIRVYYSALTAAQVLQNYNATKDRYGL
jgi:hypothetical protein